jgi:hypothetical protein
MKITVDNIDYETQYFPFFRAEKHDDFQVWNMRLPSGDLGPSFLVLHTERPIQSLTEYMEFLIREYILEDDEMLTPKAMEFKNELKELFCCHGY